jgi:predicted rRNA methylase YqxC with S4 and FtsJ domains
VGKKGVVKDPLVHQRVIEDISWPFVKESPLLVQGLTFSPIRGPEGNIEFLILWQKNHAGLTMNRLLRQASRRTEASNGNAHL